jgi:hypothetical protein
MTIESLLAKLQNAPPDAEVLVIGHSYDYTCMGPLTSIKQGYAEPGLEVLPNPAGREASVTFGLSREGQVRLELYDLLGRKISTLQDGPLTAGPKSYTLDTREHPTGIYFLRLTLSDRQYTRSLLILR